MSRRPPFGFFQRLLTQTRTRPREIFFHFPFFTVFPPDVTRSNQSAFNTNRSAFTTVDGTRVDRAVRSTLSGTRRVRPRSPRVRESAEAHARAPHCMFGTLPRKSEGDLPQTSVRDEAAALRAKMATKATHTRVARSEGDLGECPEHRSKPAAPHPRTVPRAHKSPRSFSRCSRQDSCREFEVDATRAPPRPPIRRRRGVLDLPRGQHQRQGGAHSPVQVPARGSRALHGALAAPVQRQGRGAALQVLQPGPAQLAQDLVPRRDGRRRGDRG